VGDVPDERCTFCTETDGNKPTALMQGSWFRTRKNPGRRSRPGLGGV